MSPQPTSVDRSLRDWVLACAAVATLLILGGVRLLASDAVAAHERVGLWVMVGAGVLLTAFATAVLGLRRSVGALLADPPGGEGEPAPRRRGHPYLTLFLASFVALFLEMVLIRYAGSQFRVFSFFKNVPLISAFLGLGLGCWLSAGRSRHVLSFLLWLVPLAVFLSQGALVVSRSLGPVAAVASSEHILGEPVGESPTGLRVLAGQVGMGAFCVLALMALASLFIPLGRLLGDAFERLPRLTAYTVNIVGSLAGIIAFLILAYLWTPPWIWFLIGLAPLLWWVEAGRARLVATMLIALNVTATAPSLGETIWSPYQKLVGHPIQVSLGRRAGGVRAYWVEISDVFYQVAVDLRPESLERLGGNPLPHYDEAFRILPGPPGAVLIVGSGTGNDVAAALRAGAARVDAVDIDPAIVALGRRHHPERPYDDPRVRVIVDDARAAFRRLPLAHYDAVVFGLLDSHTQLGMSSVRLDNYVYTRESLEEASRLLKPGGTLVITAATFRQWFRQRFIDLLQATCGGRIRTQNHVHWTTYACRVGVPAGSPPARDPAAAPSPTDDWPFLYLPERGIPRAYLVVILLLALASVRVIYANALSPARLDAYHAHLFFLGAGFLLMEVYAINRLALLFGTTWVVSAVGIMLVLTLIVGANLSVAAFGHLRYRFAYCALVASLVVSYSLDPQVALGQGVRVSLGYGLVALLPVYFAGLIFARSFGDAPAAGSAIGANMLGAVLGGWAEYSSMALGIRALALVALVFYAASGACLVRTLRAARRGRAAGGS
jgi:SAM-dependent methyltransferase